MTTFVIVVHVLVSLMLVLVVLLQPGNKGGMGAAFGGAGGQTVFGGRGANTFLAKLTAGAAVVFMVTSFSLVYLSSRGGSAFDRSGAPAATTDDKKDEDKKDEDKKDEAAEPPAATGEEAKPVEEAASAAEDAKPAAEEAKPAAEEAKPAETAEPAAAPAPAPVAPQE